MICDIVTLFPGLIEPLFQQSILKRAVEKGLLRIRVRDLRDFAEGKHRVADDAPYGGGPGMVLKPEPIFRAIDALRREEGPSRIILTSPQGRRFSQDLAAEFSCDTRRLVFICGHYEGVDERVREGLAVEEVSIGDYVITGGELAAMVMIDASARLVSGVLGEPDSLREESFSFWELLEYPQYTRPEEFRGMRVPSVLTSGNHRAIAAWRRQQALLNTLRKRPDLVDRLKSSDAKTE